MFPNIIYMSRSYFRKYVHIAWTSLQIHLWKVTWKNSGISLCTLLGSFRPLQTASSGCSQRTGHAPRDTGLFSRGKRWLTVLMFAINWAQHSHRIAVRTAIAMQELQRENCKSSQLLMRDHRNHERSTLSSGNKVTETRKVPVQIREAWQDRSWGCVSLIPTYLTSSF